MTASENRTDELTGLPADEVAEILAADDTVERLRLGWPVHYADDAAVKLLAQERDRCRQGADIQRDRSSSFRRVDGKPDAGAIVAVLMFSVAVVCFITAGLWALLFTAGFGAFIVAEVGCGLVITAVAVGMFAKSE